MMILYISLGVIFGGLLVFLYLNGKLRADNQIIQNLNSQLQLMQNELTTKTENIRDLQIKISQSEQISNDKEKNYIRKLDLLDERLIEKDKELKSLSEEKNQIEKETITKITNLEATNSNLQIKLEDNLKYLKEQEKKFMQIEENFKNEFKNMAQEILEEKSKKFAETGKKDINELIQPLKEKIQDFSRQVRDSYDLESKERFNLKEEIKKLNQMNVKLSDQANNLAIALKGESKTQGDWGEMILENMLNDSGLTLGREYLKQESVRDEDGHQLRPDFVIKYPDNRYIIIDSKVSLRAYEAFVSEENPEHKKAFLNQHLKAVSERVNELSTKKYQDQFEGSPDFVMMFMPIEPAFLVAVQNDSQLWNRAYEKRVIIMSPTNLIAALKMINELWKHDAQNKNTIAISDAAAALYDKFVGFYDDLNDISKSLEKVSQSFADAKGKLSTGRGNLIGRVQKLKDLGIKTKKELAVENSDMLDFDRKEEDEQ